MECIVIWLVFSQVTITVVRLGNLHAVSMRFWLIIAHIHVVSSSEQFRRCSWICTNSYFQTDDSPIMIDIRAMSRIRSTFENTPRIAPSQETYPYSPYAKIHTHIRHTCSWSRPEFRLHSDLVLHSAFFGDHKPGFPWNPICWPAFSPFWWSYS